MSIRSLHFIHFSLSSEAVMTGPELLASKEFASAIESGRAAVALESTVIAHGLPWPANLETARSMEAAVRAAGAAPATIAIWNGVPTIGLNDDQLVHLARAPDIFKASRRDLGAAIGLGRTAATTVSATIALAQAAGVRVFATGGIGGAHRSQRQPEKRDGSTLANFFDVSADLTELARTPVLVVCAGAKSILDLPRTLEILETQGVPVLGYRTDEFPAFTVSSSGLPVSARVESVEEAAHVFAAHVKFGGGGALLCQPCPANVAIPAEEYNAWLEVAEEDARQTNVTGPRLTPFLLSRLAELSGGRTLSANQALLLANARLAAEVAVQLAKDTTDGSGL